MAAAQSQVVKLCSTAPVVRRRAFIVTLIGNEIKHTKNKAENEYATLGVEPATPAPRYLQNRRTPIPCEPFIAVT